MTETTVLDGACLCGDVTYSSSQQHSEMWNCHCADCRKASSVAYATWIKTRPSSFSWIDVKSPVSLRYSSESMLRSFCSSCGTVLPVYDEKEDCIMLPAGGITTDHGLTPSMDCCTDQIPTWYAMDGCQPNSVNEIEDKAGSCTSEGSCLCGSITYSISGEHSGIRGCHCSRCRIRSGAAFFSAVPVLVSAYAPAFDESVTTVFFLPGSQYYRYSFCSSCGSLAPTLFPGAKRAVIPAGTLDTNPPLGLSHYIYYGSKVAWLNPGDNTVCFDKAPPPDV
ncbi:MAG: hypothetical protein HOC23_21690 [Halieaceae bacterium]|jgi:hypothetical protein|nr:hypothetical protein [Halieaceae bacterium]